MQNGSLEPAAGGGGGNRWNLWLGRDDLERKLKSEKRYKKETEEPGRLPGTTQESRREKE